MKQKKKKEIYYEDEELYHLLPLIFLVIIVPLIVYLKVVPLSEAMYDFWNGQKENMDFFSYYKSVWIIISTSIALLMLGIKSYQMGFKAIKYSHFYIPIGVYSIFVVLSAIFSKYPEVAKWGFVDRYEGMYVILSYMVILFVTMNLIKKETHLKVMIGALFTGALILGTIGLFQYLGYDIWKSSFGKSLMLPSQYQQYADKLNFQFGKGTIYASLYHTDYVGSYMAMLFPLTFAMFMLCKNRIFKIAMAFLTLLMAINWLGCNSRAGMVGGAVALFILLIMINKYIISHWKYFLGGLLALALVFVGLNSISKGYLSSRTKTLINDAKKITQKPSVDKNIAEESIPLKDIKVNGNLAEIITKTETLKIEINNGQVLFKDESGKKIRAKFEQDTGKINLLDDKYKNYQVIISRTEETSILQIANNIMTFNFNLTNDSITVIDNKGRPVDLNPVEKWGFEGKEKLGSARGYIWSRSIPLLKNTKLIGYGPDTFAIYFPQNDFKGKMYAYEGDMWQIVDKPHNLYLQTALSTGCISLIAMLALFLMYFINSVKIYFRNDFDNFTSIAGVGIFAAVCGYLGAGFFNDSIVSVAPVFWALLGMGIGVNYILKPVKIKVKNEKQHAI